VPYCDDAGREIKPDRPNAFKFEKFIFDALPDARRSLILEFAREEEFSPIKNAQGVDSPETARRDLMEKWARWLEAGGVVPPRDGRGELRHQIEIDPVFASSAGDLRARRPAGLSVNGDLLLR
jgi:UDP-N-acetylglucosamine/UDP-N-acetylgalactosamine diphosphorylase